MFIPILVPGVGVAGTDALVEKVRRLEQDLDTALTLLRVLSERMRHTLGPDAIGPELCRFLSAFDYSDQQDLIARLDALVRSGSQPEAVRVIRETAGVTWDQAFSIYAAWRQYSQEEKEKWVRSVQLRKALRTTGIRETGQ
jgi:hypothetical protein